MLEQLYARVDRFSYSKRFESLITTRIAMKSYIAERRVCERPYQIETGPE